MGYRLIRHEDYAGWLADRAKGIGPSEVGAIFGVSYFDTPLQLWRRKTHFDPPTVESDVMMLGHTVDEEHPCKRVFRTACSGRLERLRTRP